MDEGIGFGVHHIAILLVFQSHRGVFSPGQLGFVDAGDKSVVAHANLVVLLVDQQTAHFGGGILTFEGCQHGLEHEIFVPIQGGLGFDVVGALAIHGIILQPKGCVVKILLVVWSEDWLQFLEMKPFIVVADGMHPDVFSHFSGSDQLNVHPEASVSPADLERLLPSIEGLVIRSKTRVTGELLQKAPALKYVVRAGEGTDNIDKVACRERGVVVANTPGANNNSAAEHAIALMMTLLRETARADACMKGEGWNKSDFGGRELWNKRLGIVGLGRVGGILARRLSGFEMSTGFYDPFFKGEAPAGFERFEDIGELFAWSDIITLHVPLLEQTRGLVGRDLLSRMRPEGVLINASRGGVVDEGALMECLRNKRIGGAALDVYEKEPLPADSPLRKTPHLILTPHLGASTVEAQYRVGEAAVHQVKEFFLNQKIIHEVTA